MLQKSSAEILQAKVYASDSGMPKRNVPLGDCIQLEYNENCELVGFSLRPKIAQYLYWKDDSGINSLKKILKLVIYMNRLLQSFSSSLEDK